MPVYMTELRFGELWRRLELMKWSLQADCTNLSPPHHTHVWEELTSLDSRVRSRTANRALFKTVANQGWYLALGLYPEA